MDEPHAVKEELARRVVARVAELVDEVVVEERGMAAERLHPPAHALKRYAPSDIRMPAALEGAWFRVYEKAVAVGLAEDVLLAVVPVEAYSVLSESLGRRDFAARVFVARDGSASHIPSPADGGADDYSLSVEPEDCVGPDSLRRDPAVAELAPEGFAAGRRDCIVEVGIIEVPELRLRSGRLFAHDRKSRLERHLLREYDALGLNLEPDQTLFRLGSRIGDGHEYLDLADRRRVLDEYVVDRDDVAHVEFHASGESAHCASAGDLLALPLAGVVVPPVVVAAFGVDDLDEEFVLA